MSVTSRDCGEPDNEKACGSTGKYSRIPGYLLRSIGIKLTSNRYESKRYLKGTRWAACRRKLQFKKRRFGSGAVSGGCPLSARSIDISDARLNFNGPKPSDLLRSIRVRHPLDRCLDKVEYRVFNISFRKLRLRI